ncbi:hypothetical protein GOP47_0019122 [Adiantum capillus-veneris]|uniref:Uncharacterized protein n=1 Tax=Adiantum capillus-veneris TaxID=13818 RepID=A0A9D4UFF5_ADICA|nr:hypothetical protein GOP47_0019122 [Adiantum capillus-veneris]
MHTMLCLFPCGGLTFVHTMVVEKIQRLITALRRRRRRQSTESREEAPSSRARSYPRVEDKHAEEEKQEAEDVLAEYLRRMEQRQKLVSLLAYHNMIIQPTRMALETIPEEEEEDDDEQESFFDPSHTSLTHDMQSCVTPTGTTLLALAQY